MTDREMSDVEYHESGQAKRDLYDALMEAQAEITRLRAEAARAQRVIEAARKCTSCNPTDGPHIELDEALEQLDALKYRALQPEDGT
jgi:hypothetical protein